MTDVHELIKAAEQRLQPAFFRLEEIALHNEKRVLDAFREEPSPGPCRRRMLWYVLRSPTVPMPSSWP